MAGLVPAITILKGETFQSIEITGMRPVMT